MVLQRAALWKGTNGWGWRYSQKRGILTGEIEQGRYLHTRGICSSCNEICAINPNLLSTKEIGNRYQSVESEGIESAPPIKETLKIHKLERFINNRGVSSIKFYNTAPDEEPLHTKWYSKAGALICGHKESNVGDDHCANCFDLYCENGIDWLQCPACKKWFHETCFYV